MVTDSTAYLPAALAARHHIAVVALHVALAGRAGAETVEVGPGEVAAALAERRVAVTTSRPTPGEFAEAYRATAAARVVSVHLSSALSGTVDSARLAAAVVLAEGIEVQVVDSRTIAMALGFAAIAGAEIAGTGADLPTVAAGIEQVSAATTALFYVDTLEQLRRGGRITAAAALVGTALGVKPLLQVVDGQIAVLEKVRTSSRALARLEQRAVEAAGAGPVDLAVHHLAAESRASLLADRLRARLPGLRSWCVSEVGAVVGAHVGPGLLGVVVSPR